MSKQLVMYDGAGDHWRDMPPGGDAYAGYLGDSISSIANFSHVVAAHFGKAHCVSIGIRKDTICALLDVEPGNPVRTPEDVRFSFNHRKANGVWRPGFYADQSDMAAIVIPGLVGIPRNEYRLLVAKPGADRIPPGFDGCQIEFAGNYDKSLLLPSFFPEPAPSKKRKFPLPHKPKPIHRKVQGAIGGGGLTTGLIALVHGAFHVTLTPAEAGAIATAVAALVAYYVPSAK